MADGPDEGKALLGHKVTKPLELEGFRYRTVRTGRTSGRGLGAGTRESMGRELYKPPKSKFSGVHLYVHPPRKQWKGFWAMWVESHKPKMAN